MYIALMIAILAISAVPVHAQDHSNPTKLKADAQNAVNIISGGKLKIQAYCAILDLNDQIDDAKLFDTKKATELSEQRNDLAKKLGPEFSTLADNLKDIDPNFQDGQEIGSILDELDHLCGD